MDLEVEIMDDFENKDNNEQNIEIPKENIEEPVESRAEEQPQLEPEPQANEASQYQAPPQPIQYHNNYEPTPPVKERPRRSTGLAYLAIGLIGALIGGFIMAAIAPTYLYGKIIPYPKGTVSPTQLGQQVVIKPTDNVTVATAVAKKNMPAVVGISTVTTQQDLFGYTRQSEGVGAGFVVNPNGYIVTNAHVIEGAPDKITVYFMDGKELPGTVLWQDTTLDMAVVKVAATNLPVVELGDSDNIQVGETAIAIGNPLGLRYERTVTQGIVSGLNRSIRVSQTDIMEDLIQTDAAINPGNSGGPLINASGQIIGINTAKASAEGLGFAIPINIAKPIVAQLINTGKFQTPYIGIGLLDREIAGYLDTQDIKITSGIYITNIAAGYPAEKAGLKVGDIITHVDGTEVNTMVKFKSLLYNKKPGDTVNIKYMRNNQTYSTTVTLIAKPVQ